MSNKEKIKGNLVFRKNLKRENRIYIKNLFVFRILKNTNMIKFFNKEEIITKSKKCFYENLNSIHQVNMENLSLVKHLVKKG